jgi:hypothetical protein
MMASIVVIDRFWKDPIVAAHLTLLNMDTFDLEPEFAAIEEPAVRTSTPRKAR